MASRARYIDGAQVEVEIPERPRGVPALAHLHRDERTALAAARTVARERGARVVTLRGDLERRLVFEMGSDRCSFDPNRAFTPAGRELTLEAPVGVRDEALGVVQQFAREYLHALGDGPWIAVHNNSPGPPLSIHSFVPGAPDDALAEAVYVAPDQTEDDFALVTTRALFDGFRLAGRNVVLQVRRPRDDGSFSVYAAREGVPYVNIEALDDHLEQQVELIRLAFDLLARPGE